MEMAKIGIMSVALVSLLSVATQVMPLITAPSQTSIPLPSSSDSGACFQNINGAMARQTLSSDQAAHLLNVAENSKQYRTFAQAEGDVSPVSGGPAIVYHTAAGCAGIVIQAYDFSFVSGGKELTIGVDPNTQQVEGSMIVPAVTWG